MSDPGLREALAAQLQKQGGGAPPGAGGQQQPQQGGNQGGLGQLAQVYAKCEQSGQCSPQEAQILAQGLPQLMKMAQNIQHILQSVQQGVGQQQPAPPPQ